MSSPSSHISSRTSGAPLHGANRAGAVLPPAHADYQSLPVDTVIGKDGKIGKDRVVYYKKSFSVGGDVSKGKNKTAPTAYEKMEIIEREAFAESLTSKFLDSGLDVWVTAVGKKKTTLKMSTHLAGNVFVHKIINNESLFFQMKGKGFKKILFDDRDGFTYPYKLD